MFSDPVKIVEVLPIYAGSQVADLGAGSGAYSFAVGKMVKHGAGGRVYAIDVQKEMLEHLEKEAEARGIDTIVSVRGNIEEREGTRLRDESIDVAVIANALFQVEEKTTLAKEAFRIVKGDGVVLIVDWTDSFGGMGPHKDAVYPKERAIELFTTAGFSMEREVDAGEHHYGLIFKKVVKKYEE